MHQVNTFFIKPATAVVEVQLPPRRGASEPRRVQVHGLSYALACNLAEGGRPCELFLSHAWDEPFFEFAARVLAEWPDDCRGAYLCSFSNPQNLDISKLLGSSVRDSPFYRVIHAPTPPRELLMVGNSITPIHRRLWCVLEALSLIHI